MEIEEKYISNHEDITRDGIIGNYLHGNESGHHIPHLYNWAGHPEKTQETVRMIMNTMYGSTVEGLCGNDDAGQMSAWYVCISLGFIRLLRVHRFMPWAALWKLRQKYIWKMVIS